MFVTIPMFTQGEMKTLDKYAAMIFGCKYDDLSDNEQKLLIAHVRDREPDFQRRVGVLYGNASVL